jgi:hypothetical protein
MKFIIWDPKDGNGLPRVDPDTGAITSDGVLGRITEDNVYLRAYPTWPADAKPIAELEVGEPIFGVRYTLSGGSGFYDVYRVE